MIVGGINEIQMMKIPAVSKKIRIKFTLYFVLSAFTPVSLKSTFKRKRRK